MRPLRKDRWLTLGEVIALLAERYPDLLQLRHRERRQKVRRIIRRAERRDGERYSKFVPAPGGREIVVSRNALESLLPYDQRSVANIERATAENAQNHRQLRRQVNGLGSRVGIVEKKQQAIDVYIRTVNALDASAARQQRVT